MKLFTLALSLAVLAAAAQDEVSLKFSYREGDRETMRMDMKMKMDVSVNSDMGDMEQKMQGPLGFTIRKKCVKSSDAEFDFEAEFGELSMEQEMDVGGQRMKMRVKGKEVRVEGENGEVIIDTEEGVNEEMAAPILKEFEGFHQKLDLTMDRRGLMKGLEKNPKVKEFFQGIGGDNLYPVILPEKAVKVGDEWRHVNKLEDLGKFKITGKPLEVPAKFKLERFEGEGDSRIAVISMKVEAELKDVESKGKMEGLAEEATLKIGKMTLSAKGETRFLVAAGRLSLATIDMAMKADMAMTSDELGGEMNMTLDMTISGKVAPEGTPTGDKK